MRVLQLCKFYHPFHGGMETVVRELTEGAVRQGVKTDVLCANTQPRTQVDLADSGYRIVRASSWGRLLSTSLSPSLIVQARRMCRDVDIVHVHMPDPMAALALRIARPTAKIVVHWHSDIVRQKLALRVYRPLQNWLLRRADAIVATSSAYAQSSPCLRPWQNKVVVIPIGISDPAASPTPQPDVQRIREAYGDRKIVFSLGRMAYYKGFDVLIDAAADLRDDCVVVIGGDGELLAQLRDQVARRGLSRKVFLVGRIPESDLGAYFRAATMFCLASTQRAEAYGVVLVEAMAMGKPVVGTDIPGAAVPWINISGVTGLNVPVRDARALSSAINRIAADPGLATRLGTAARARYEQCLGADAMVDGTLALYRRLMSAETGSTADVAVDSGPRSANPS